ncbi:MAG: glycoside hydrolase family 1 protein [Spartobacteria bacterium]|nr:glycoside hydrolase family 1 protein [Spartobacteria bacterium]
MNNQNEQLSFPKGFIWGTSTAGHQVEGDNRHSDWWAWEQQGLAHGGHHSGRSVDYWNRFEADHALMAELGYKAFRLGVEWARIEPRRGFFDPHVVRRYHEIFQSLQKHAIRICLTINHWVLPHWVSQQHDWLNPQTLDDFEAFTAFVVKEFGAYPDFWVTLNEPMVPAIAGNLLAYFPPQRRSFRAYRKVSGALLEAHARAYRTIHRELKRAPDGGPPMVGVAHAYPLFNAWDSFGLAGCWERVAARVARLFAHKAWDQSIQTGRAHWIHGGRYIEGLKDSYDYCGINYYTRMTLKYNPAKKDQWRIDEAHIPGGIKRTQMGWQIYPEGFRHVIRTVWKRFGKPIIITENGIADAQDQSRPRYLVEHLAALHDCIVEGIPVQAYFHWSFMDNYEWREGYTQKFGLIAVDQNDPCLTRKPRPSAYLYSDIIRHNAITEEMRHRFNV